MPIRAISAGRTGSTCARPRADYADRDPTVLVVGGGQAGLSIAARLKQLQIDTLIVDRGTRIGDNWRKRYHALTLHNQVQVNHLPYMPFPPNWPTYIPEGQARQLVRGLCRSAWSSTSGPAPSSRAARYDETAGTLDRHAAPRRRQPAHDASAPCRDGDRRQRHPECARHSEPEEFHRHGRCIPANMTTARIGKASARW